MNKNSDTVGEKLSKKRALLELEIKDAADEIQAPKKYIEALESDNYVIFSAKVYALGFLKKYIKFLNFDGDAADEILKKFNQEWEVATFQRNKDIKKIPEIKERVFILTPHKMALISGLFILLTTIGYFVYQLKSLGSPELSVDFPPDNYLSGDLSLEVSGRLKKNADLTVNGRTLYINDGGFFKDSLNLAIGLNTLEFKAINKFGKESKIIRRVLVK